MKINFKRIDHVLITIPVGETANARDFYANVMGLEEIPGNHPRGSIWFKIGGIELHINEEKQGEISGRHPAFEINNLKDVENYLVSKGVDVSYSSKIEGRERFFIRDPFKNRIEFIEFDK